MEGAMAERTETREIPAWERAARAVSTVDLGRLYYEHCAAKAEHPWTPWEELHEWERERERANAWGRARMCWAKEHEGATAWPPPEEMAAFAVESLERWAWWPR
jgi:hypothetical protein